MVLLPRAVTPLLARRTRRYRTRDAGVQTNRELCDTKRIITRRLDRSYVSSPPPPRLPPFPSLSHGSFPRITSAPHACNNVKLFSPLYVNFRKCALSLLPSSSSSSSSIYLCSCSKIAPSVYHFANIAADTLLVKRRAWLTLGKRVANVPVAFYTLSAIYAERSVIESIIARARREQAAAALLLPLKKKRE